MPETNAEAILLFDGVCNLCDATVRFVFAHDPQQRFRFAPLQSETSQRLLAERGLESPRGPGVGPESMVLLADGQVFTHSTAALETARRLRRPWPLLALLLLIPRPVRDLLYRLIARNRYRLWGKKEACELPPPGLRERFLTGE